MTGRKLDIFPITTRTLEVLRVQDVTPGMRRVTLGGPQLAAFDAPTGYPVAAFRSDGFDDEFKLLIKHPDVPQAIGPTQADGLLNWPRDPKMLVRTYTVRRFDAGRGEIEVDLVRHAGGAASDWAQGAQVGDKMQVAGPKMSAGLPTGADWLLLGGDETALPAISRLLEHWSEQADKVQRAQIFIEIRKDAYRQELPLPQGVELTWLSRENAQGAGENLLLSALQNLDWWPGEVFVWLAGEGNMLKPVREFLQQKGLSREQLDITVHWTRKPAAEPTVQGGTDQSSAIQPSATPQEDSEAIYERFQALSDLVTPLAIRVAVTLGLGQLLESGAKTAAELSSNTGAKPEALPLLLRLLVSQGLLSQEGDHYALSALGQELTEEDHAITLNLNTEAGQRDLALLGMLGALVDGAVPATKPEDAFNAVLDDEAYMARYYAAPLPQALGQVRQLSVLGKAAPAYAQALAGALPELEITALFPQAEQTFWQSWLPSDHRLKLQVGEELQPSEAVLLTDPLTTLDSAAAVALLRRSASALTPGGRLLLWTEPRQDILSDPESAGEDLRQFVATGGHQRSDPELRELIARAGLQVNQTEMLGWGMVLYQLQKQL